jgi:hypothetical protein
MSSRAFRLESGVGIEDRRHREATGSRGPLLRRAIDGSCRVLARDTACMTLRREPIRPRVPVQTADPFRRPDKCPSARQVRENYRKVKK